MAIPVRINHAAPRLEIYRVFFPALKLGNQILITEPQIVDKKGRARLQSSLRD